tara:strand:- start:357 stop:653 length:297 start_codon:yes stop_codon:yes gene_type:complete
MADGTDNRVFDRMAQASKDPGISPLFELRKQNFLDVLGKGIRAKREGATDRQIVDFMKSRLELTGRVNFSDKAYLDIIKGGKIGNIPQDYMLQYVYNF